MNSKSKSRVLQGNLKLDEKHFSKYRTSHNVAKRGENHFMIVRNQNVMCIHLCNLFVVMILYGLTCMSL